MKNWSRLILPLGLGALATIINAGIMKTRLTPIQLVSVNRDIEPGQKFTDADLIRVDVGYPSAHLKDHFFLWDERDALHGEVCAVTQLKKGELIPKVEFGEYGRSTFVIPENSLMIGFRIREDLMDSQDRRLLIPGKRVRLAFDSGAAVDSATIAFIEPGKAEKPKDRNQRYYQIGVFIERNMKKEIELVAKETVNQIIGLSVSGSGS